MKLFGKWPPSAAAIILGCCNARTCSTLWVSPEKYSDIISSANERAFLVIIFRFFSGIAVHSAEVFTLRVLLPPDHHVRMVLGEQVSIPCVASNTQRALMCEDNAHSNILCRAYGR
jgi:hypothetical protein